MAEIIHCPECERSVSVPERLFGKLVRCPSCKATFRAQAPEEEEPELEVVEEEPPRRTKPTRRDEEEEEVPRRKPRTEDEEEEAPRPRRREPDDKEDARRPRRARSKMEDEEAEVERPRRRLRDADEEDDEDEPPRRRKRIKLTGDEIWSWKRVRVGLTLVMAAAAVGLLANVVGVVWFRSVEMSDAPAPSGRGTTAVSASFSTGFIALLVVYFLLCFVGVGLAIWGNIVCMAFRGKLSARSTLTSCIAMLILGLFLFAGGLAFLYVRVRLWSSSPTSAPPLEGLVIYIFGATVLLAQPGVFSLFVRNVAEGTRQGGLALTLILQAIVAGGIALAFVIAAMSQYSSLTGVMSAVYEGTGRGGVQEVGDTAESVLKILFFAEIGYVAWFVTSIILAHVGISRLVQRRWVEN
jgi:hypothetical protein